MSWWQNFLAEAKNMLIKDPRRIIFLVGASIAYLVLFSILYSPGISSGESCKSASIVMITSPCAFSNPQYRAGLFP